MKNELSLCLLLLGTGFVRAQPSGAPSGRPADAGGLSDEQRERLEKKYGIKLGKQIYGTPEQVERHLERQFREDRQTREKMLTVWEDYKAGKRDWKDGYVAAERLRIATTLTAPEESNRWREELERLREARKAELQGGPPVLLGEEQEARRKAALAPQEDEYYRQLAKERRLVAEFYPKAFGVKRIGDVISLWRRFAVRPEDLEIYPGDHRIEFYRLPEGTDIEITDDEGRTHNYPEKLGGIVKFRKGGKDFTPKPYLSLSFKLPVTVMDNRIHHDSLLAPKLGGARPPSAFLITTMLYHLPDEIIRRELRIREGQFEEFYGVVSSDGKILVRFDFHSKSPDRVAMPIGISIDGKRAVLGIGPSGVSNKGGDSSPTVLVHEVLLWEFPDKVRKLDPCTQENANAIWSSVGRGFYTDICPGKFGWESPE